MNETTDAAAIVAAQWRSGGPVVRAGMIAGAIRACRIWTRPLALAS
jgi:hypothetical protein